MTSEPMQPKGHRTAKNGWVSCHHPAAVPTTKASSFRWRILTEWQTEQASRAGRKPTALRRRRMRRQASICRSHLRRSTTMIFARFVAVLLNRYMKCAISMAVISRPAACEWLTRIRTVKTTQKPRYRIAYRMDALIPCARWPIASNAKRRKTPRAALLCCSRSSISSTVRNTTQASVRFSSRTRRPKNGSTSTLAPNRSLDAPNPIRPSATTRKQKGRLTYREASTCYYGGESAQF